MTPSEVLARINEPECHEDVALHWDASMAVFPGTGAVPFLQRDQWLRSRQWAGFNTAVNAWLAEAAARIGGDPALEALAWHCFWRVFEAPEPAPLKNWPEFTTSLGEYAGGLYLLVALAVVPRMAAHHRRLGIPPHITRETAVQVQCYCDHTYRRGHGGRPGIYPSQLNWLRHYTRERYVRLGRLEYWLGPNPYDVLVLRKRDSGRTLALAPPGVHCTPEGMINANQNGNGEEEGWTTVRSDNGQQVRGHPIDPSGHVVNHAVTLDRSAWQTVLCKGMPSLQLHIPSGGDMSPAACGASLRRAVRFCQRHAPDEFPAAVVCTSWIFGPPLQQILPPQSNLVAFQRELYLFPVPSHNHAGLWFVFLQHTIDPATAPRETSIQRTLLDYLEAGHRWRHGGMFLLTDDIPAFGNQTYLAAWPDLASELDLEQPRHQASAP